METSTSVADQIRADLVEAVRWTSEFSGRSAQTQIGPSEIGHPCDRRLAYKLAEYPATNTTSDPLAAFIGTGGHTALEKVFEDYEGQSYEAWARLRANPDDEEAQRAASLAPYRDNPRYQVETRLEVPSGRIADGKCDLFDHHRRAVIDHKFVGAWSMNRARVFGPSAAYRVQAHTYGLGWETRTGTAPDHVAISYWPREKSERYGVQVHLNYVWVWSEPYDRSVALAAIDRVNRVGDLADELDTDRYPDLFGAFTTTPDACRFCEWHNKSAANPGQGCPGI